MLAPKVHKGVFAHRYAYAWLYGDIPGGMQVLHRCDVRLCVNPDHLFLGTQLDNMRDMCAKGRSRSQIKTHCRYGHPFEGSNLYIDSRGARQCRICKNLYGKLYKREMRARQRNST
jgi:hypothetical protein